MNPPVNCTVSCIMPVYNGERFLAETLESLLAQTYPLHEILVVDDGSTDGTRRVVDAYIAKSSISIRYFWQPNTGPATARNLGIQNSVGEFLTFIDADDLWHPEKTARQLARFAARPELEASVAHIQNFWMEEVREEEERMRDHPRAKPIAGYASQVMMARRTIFAKVGMLNETLMHSDDTDWFIRAQELQVVIELMPDVLMMRRLHRDNRSRLYAKQSQAEYLRTMHAARKRQRLQAVNATQTATPSPMLPPTESPAE